MKTPHFNDTITAIATPSGVGAIGIVRLTGPESRVVLERLWISSVVSVDKMETHRFYYGKLAETGCKTPPNSPNIHSAPAPIIDEIMAVFFAGPRSYTGEDMVELYCHGGAVVLQEILAACVSAGARLAEPGEFTQRAFLNGKMDLAQAEGVAGVIHATSDAARRNATDQLTGRLSAVIRRAMDQLTELRAFVEATIDFPEEDIEMIAHAGVVERLAPIRRHLSQLSETYATGRLLSDGVRVVLVGAPNVGKSSLMNLLLGQDRSIVHEVPGTTRDYVDAVWNLNGIAVHLTDTAGLREGQEEVERLGIERSRQKMDEADVVIMVCDGTRALTAAEQELVAALPMGRSLVVINKCDLPMPSLVVQGISISAHTGEGRAGLEESLCSLLQGTGPKDVEGVTISALRHKQALERSIVALTAAESCVTAAGSAEFIAHHLTEASQALGEIVGEVTTDELLGQIFSKFCIGK
jgi:tRNA modification GTPase